MTTVCTKRLTYEAWRAMPLPERRLLMRAAFGAPDVPECFTSDFDLAQVRAMLEEHEDGVRWMPEKWTDSAEDDLGEACE